MNPQIHVVLIRPDGSRSDVNHAGATPEMLDMAEDLITTIATGERPPLKGLYDLCARAFGTTRDDAKACLLRAAYGGKPQETDLRSTDDAEMIAQWIEGYANEPMDSAIIAKAIRDGKWRAS